MVASRPGGATCSPHARGWSQRDQPPRCRGPVLPARAGMVPGPGRTPASRWGAPRTRRDGPPVAPGRLVGVLCSPARAGMVPGRAGGRGIWRCAPRTRGDGPLGGDRLTAGTQCSPHARGWSQVDRVRHDGGMVLPAGAGMVPRCPARPRRPRCAPHTRGVAPTPVPAGRRTCAPHARGDVPEGRLPTPTMAVCSPHAWGCQAGRAQRHHGHQVFPAHAGLQSPAGVPSCSCITTRDRSHPCTHAGISRVPFVRDD